MATAHTAQHISHLIVGSGFSGLGMGRRLKTDGIEDFLILERGAGVGGVWEANTYPGCTCDVPSHLYSFSYAPNPNWSSTYSPQPEIRDYLRACVDRFGLRAHLRLGVEVTGARWDEDTLRWHVDTSAGTFTCDILISAVGPITEPKLPDVPGIDTFEGTVMHSGQWRHDIDLTGLRVASIGTGSSAIQYVPRIADEAGELFVFQRTAPWIAPHDKRPTTEAERARFRGNPAAQRRARASAYLSKEGLVLGFAKAPIIMKAVELVARKHLKDQVPDPALRAQLTPDFTIGCKRILPSNEWYPALQKPRVHLVPKALKEIRPHAVVDADGVEREVDVIIFGTGYQVAEPPIAGLLRGPGGQLLQDAWAGAPHAYLGTSVPGFPNFFLLLGPNSALGHSSMVYMSEAQVDHVGETLKLMRGAGANRVEVRRDVHDAYNRDIDRKLARSVWERGGCTGYYRDSTGRNSTIWPDWTWRFRRLAAHGDPRAYHLKQVRVA